MAAVFWHDGIWTTENPKLVGPADHALWMASCIFDGARAFDGLAPDLDRHCARAIASAKSLGLAPKLNAAEIEKLAREAVAKFPRDAALYIKPMFWATEGTVLFDPASTRFALHVWELPMPAKPTFTAMKSSFRRPAPDMAVTDAKAASLYPNTARAVREAVDKGYDNAVMLDPDGNVAEFASANLWCVKDGVAMTPKPNGTFLAGITRLRTLTLLREAGMSVEERTLSFADVMAADEVFNTGNMGKVMACTRLEDRDLQPGPVFTKARDLYFKFAATQPA
jgi:branched-chain amino acid aminotransferase